MKLLHEHTYGYTGEHLIFEETTDGFWTIENKEYESLGILKEQKVGAWNGWVLYLNDSCWLSASCQDEVREMTKILNNKIRKKELGGEGK